MKHKPLYLPQINMPVDAVVKQLDEEGVDYEYVQIQPSESDGINPSQGFTFSDDVGKVELDDKNPIWLAKEGDKDKICDGHHRYTRALLDEVPMTAIKIDMDFKDACRLLNKIQDVYDYTEQQRMEEVVAQDVVNANNETNSGASYNEFLSSLEEDNAGIQAEKPSKNDKVIIGYRRDPISETSVIGNFFTISPIEGFTPYEIEFENLLDTNDLGVQFKDSQIPAEILAKIWFPHVNFEKLSEQYNIPSLNLKNKAIAEKAKHMGFDGIKYGDTLLQGLK
jgi:hypothetical protein